MTRLMMEDIRTNGEVTHGPMKGQPLMLLTTTGAKSGLPRTSIVTYSRDGDRFVIAASKGGAPSNPGWYHNLMANPQVTIETGGETFAATATVVNGDRRDELWDQHAEQLPWFKEYPTKTTRVIPVIVLDRAA